MYFKSSDSGIISRSDIRQPLLPPRIITTLIMPKNTPPITKPGRLSGYTLDPPFEGFIPMVFSFISLSQDLVERLPDPPLAKTGLTERLLYED
jgi:hypothetical protein